MANQEAVKLLQGYASAFKGLDREKILRSDLGKASLNDDFAPILDLLVKKVSFAAEYVSSVHDSTVNSFNGVIGQIVNRINAQMALDTGQFVSGKADFIAFMDQQVAQIEQFWPPFITAAIEARGFLEDEGIRKEYQRAVDRMKNESESALKALAQESNKNLEEARKLADEIEQKARRTATHISVEAARDVFKEARRTQFWQVILWAGLSLLSVCLFLITAYYFYRTPLFGEAKIITEQIKWTFVYESVLRIIILTVIAALTTFFLKMFRANMHLYQHNLHRQNITNCMAAFVELAVTSEQRDLILQHLVDAVATFGCSGLIQNEDDSVQLPKITIDTIARTLTQK